jgi:hypothetical protein
MKVKRYRLAGSNPETVHEIFTIGELINRMATLWHPWEIHRFEKIAVVHFLN